MAQDTEETLRIILMLGQAVVPAARDVLGLMARAVTVVGRTGAKATQAGFRAVTDRVDGMGRTGVVRSAKSLTGAVQTVDVTDKLGRADIHELGRLCRACGVGFAVTRINAGDGTRMAIQFSAADASTMEAVLNAALASRLVAKDDLDRSCSTPDPAAERIDFAGSLWTRSGSEFTCGFETHDGRKMTAHASPDGSWSITDPAGAVAMAGPESIRGRAGADLGADLGGALTLAAANMRAMTDAKVALANARWRNSPEFIAGLRSKDIIKAASDVVERRKPAAGRGMKPGVAPRPRVQRSIKR